MDNIKNYVKNPRVLILSPTRELAGQIFSYAEKFSEVVGLKSVILYGGVSKWEQIKILKNSSRYNFNLDADIVVGTPGRILDLIALNKLILENTTYIVIDEADRLLVREVIKIGHGFRASTQINSFSN